MKKGSPKAPLSVITPSLESEKLEGEVREHLNHSRVAAQVLGDVPESDIARDQEVTGAGEAE